jgi:hypothetical protein
VGAGRERGPAVVRVLVHRQHEYADLWTALAQLANRRRAAQPGHAHVEQRQVRIRRARGSDRFLPVRRLSDHAHVGLVGEHAGEPFAHHRVVIGDQDAHPAHRRASF